MSDHEQDVTTTVAAIAGITAIICAGCLVGLNHTLVKLGIAAIAGLGGFSLRGIIRRTK